MLLKRLQRRDTCGMKEKGPCFEMSVLGLTKRTLINRVTSDIPKRPEGVKESDV